MTRPIKAFFSYARRISDGWLDEHAELRSHIEKRIVAKLGVGSFEFWRDQTDLVPGQPWAPALDEAAAGCDMLVVMLSQLWLDSEYCRREYRTFVDRKRADAWVVPVLAMTIDRTPAEPEKREILQELMRLQALNIPLAEVSKALCSPNHNAAFNALLDVPLQRLIERMAWLEKELVAGSLLQTRCIAGVELEFIEVAAGAHEVGVAGGLQPVDITRPYLISSRPVSLLQLATALGASPRPVTCLDLDAVQERLASSGTPIGIASETQWECAFVRGGRMLRAGGNGGLQPPSEGRLEVVADSFDRIQRRAVPRDGGAVEGATGQRVQVGVLAGKKLRAGLPEDAECEDLLFRLVLPS